MVNGDRSSSRVFLALVRYPALYCTYRYLELLRLLGYQMPTQKQLAVALAAHVDTMGTHLRMLRKIGLLRCTKRRVLMVTQFDRWTLGVLELLTGAGAVLDFKHESCTVLDSGLELEWQHGPRTEVGFEAIQPISATDAVNPLVASSSTEGVPETEPAEATEGFGVVCSSFDLDLLRTTTTTSTDQEHTTSKPAAPISLGLLIKKIQPAAAAAKAGGRPALVITDEMRAVYDGWADATHTRKLTLKPGPTASRLRSRLAEGFTIADLLLVAEWAAQDPWMSGTDPKSTGPFLSTETLYRNSERVAGYIAKAEKWVAAGRPAHGGVFDRRQIGLAANAPKVGVDTIW